jgi:hypothetical protein
MVTSLYVMRRWAEREIDRGRPPGAELRLLVELLCASDAGDVYTTPRPQDVGRARVAGAGDVLELGGPT